MRSGSLNFLFLAIATSSIAFACGWLESSWRHDQSRRIPPATLASASETLCFVHLETLATSSWKNGDRLDILASTADMDIPLVLDAILITDNTTTPYCLMPLTDGRLLTQAIANGTAITFRASVVPGDRLVSSQHETVGKQLPE